MRMRNVIAAGLGIGACLCCAIAVSTAQQPQQSRRHFTVQRVTNGDMSPDPSSANAANNAKVSEASAASPTDAPRLMQAPGPQRVLITEPDSLLRGGVPGLCGDKTVTLNADPNTVLIGQSTVACSQAAGSITVENSWALCFDGSNFPIDFVLECVDVGIESNTSPANTPFDVDIRISELVPSVAFPTLACPLPPVAANFVFGDTANTGETWFDVGPGTTRPEFNVLLLQRVRIPDDFQGIFKATLNTLVTIPTGTNLLVEFHAPDRAGTSGGDNGALRPGSNAANAPGDFASYIWAPQCGLTAYQDINTVDPSFTEDLVMRLDGSDAVIMGACCDNAAATCSITDSVTCAGIGGRFCPNVLSCPASGAPFCPSVQGPASPPCGATVPNDECTGAIVLSNSDMATFSTLIATTSAIADPAGFDTVNNDVWFAYIVKDVPPVTILNGRLLVSTFGSDFDTSLAVYRVVQPQFGPPLDVRTPADLTAICNSIAANDGVAAVAEAGGFGDDVQGANNVDNRPGARINRLTYISISDPNPIVPGDQFLIHVGSPFTSGGQGVLNVDYLPISPLPWTSGSDPGGRCCQNNGDCQIVPTEADCIALNGFFRNRTDFFFGRDLAELAADPNNVPPFEALVEITSVGCKVLPCGGLGANCFNPIDLKQLLIARDGTAFGTVTRLTKTKLYFKYQLMPGINAIEIDSCGSLDFDTFIEVFKWDPAYPHNCVKISTGSGVNDLKPGDVDPGSPLPTKDVPLPANTGTVLVVNGREMINDDCRFQLNDPEQATALSAADSARCYDALGSTETDSCLCFPLNTGDAGNNAGDWILICVGAFNPDRDAAGINSIDPVENPTFPAKLASITIQAVNQCFSCVLDLSNPGSISVPGSPGTPFASDLDEQTAGIEPICIDGVQNSTNDGCGGFLMLSNDPPQSTAIATPAVGQPFYISGTSGVANLTSPVDPNNPIFHEDNDWYRITLNQPKRVTWRLVRAEFPAQIAILKQGDPAFGSLCNTTGFLVNTTTVCDDDTLNDLTVDCCPGTYFLMVRPRPPFVPMPCGTLSEYLCCLEVNDPPSVGCCPGDGDNNGIFNGDDIQTFVDTMVFPPAADLASGIAIGGCFSLQACHADINGDGALTVADVGLFVTRLLNKTPCPAAPPLCTDPSRCQLPSQLNVGLDRMLSSDLNIQSFNADPATPDNFRAADCFCPTETGNITQVCWWGAYQDRDAIMVEDSANVDCANTDDFKITYYFNQVVTLASPPNEPATKCPVGVKDGPFDLAGGLSLVTRTTTGNTLTVQVNTNPNVFADLTEYRYEATLASPVHVTAGECYWLSIVNNTTGRCTWRWEVSTSGDGRAYIQEDRNQNFDPATTFPTVWDCLRNRIGVNRFLGAVTAPFDLAFCQDILTRRTGCEEGTLVTGKCCFGALGHEQCLVLTEDECTVTYGGVWTANGDCQAPCPPGVCEVLCLPGDVIEAEGCGFNENGGCDEDLMNPPIFDLGTLACNVNGVGGSPITICGTANNVDQNGIDSDWYSFTITGNPANESTISVVIESAPDMIVQLRQSVPPNTPATDGCSAFIAQATSDPGNCDPIDANPGCLADGVYLIRVLSSFNSNVTCDEATYRVTISCIAPCCVIDPCPNQPFVRQEQGDAQAVCAEQNGFLNDGCLQNGPPVFETIPVDFDPCNPLNPVPVGGGGTFFCGTSWADNNNRDTDWWGPLAIPAGGQVINIAFRSEFPGIIFMADVGDAASGNEADCILQNVVFSSTFAPSVNCAGVDENGNPTVFASFSECLPEGNWAIFVAPGRTDGGGVFNGTPPCSTRTNYQMQVTCGAVGCTPTCFPGSLSSQFPKLQGVNVGIGGAGLVGQLSSDRNGLANNLAADNFLAVSGGSVSEVQWWGFYLNTVPATDESCVPQTGDSIDDFTITYYGSQTFTSGIPGVGVITIPDNNVLGGPFSQSGGSLMNVTKQQLTGQRFQINGDPPDFIDLIEFRASHAPVAFSAGTCVWIEIVNNTGGNCTWGWEVSEDGDRTAAQRNGNAMQDPQQFYKDGDQFEDVDLAWCLNIKTGPTGCFDFAPACNDVCTGAMVPSCALLMCDLRSGQSDQITYDLVNYSSQGPLFEPDTLGIFGTPGMNHKDAELISFGLGVPPKEAVAWFKFIPAVGPQGQTTGTATITIIEATFAEILVFNPIGAGGATVTCSNIAGPGEIADTQFQADVPPQFSGIAPTVSGTFIAGQEYLIMVAYYEGFTTDRNNIFESLDQTIRVTCEP